MPSHGSLAQRFLCSSLLKIAVFLIGTCCGLGPVNAELKFARLFSDHAVLQRDRPILVWGWADSGDRITVTFADQTVEAVASETGRWQVTLEPLATSSTGRVLEARDDDGEVVRAEDLLVGDVWLCSGQSNMDWPLGACDTPQEIAAADFPAIRHFGVEMDFAQEVRRDCRGDWRVCRPDTAAGFTAVGFHFAKQVHQETGVPIGLLRSSVGGTNIELWMSQETLLETPALAPYAALMQESLARYREELAASLDSMEAWLAAARDAQQTGSPLPLPPAWPEYPFMERVARPRCVTLHNGMIAPLIGYQVRGFLWYQGENNAGGVNEGEQYLEKKRALITDWRKWFGDGSELPFYYVQLTSWQAPQDRNSDEAAAGADGWAIFREAQRKCLTIPGTGMAVTIDIGDANDIHPRNKQDVGRRLAQWALADVYQQTSVVRSGPLFREATIEGQQIRIRFDAVDGGLIVGSKQGLDPVVTLRTDSPTGFAIAGEDRKWRWAQAKIVGDEVLVSHPEIPNPVAVRYAFAMNPEGANLYNAAGLPASPFRTDSW